MSRMLEYIKFLEDKHRATLDTLRRVGKTFRSRDVAREYGYLNALRDIQDAIEQPGKNRQLEEAMKAFGERLKE